MVMIEDEEQAEHRALAPHELRALQALSRADAALNAPRPYAGGGDAYEAMARDAAASDQQRPAPSRAEPPAAVADDAGDDGFVRTGVMVKLLQLLVQEERARSAAAIEELARRVAVLESRAAGGANRKGKRK